MIETERRERTAATSLPLSRSTGRRVDAVLRPIADALARRPPRPARRHAARRAAASRLHRACCRASACGSDAREPSASRRARSSGTTVASREPACASSGRCARSIAEQSNTSMVIGDRLCAQALPPDRARHQSGDRDRPLPHRRRGFANTPPLLGRSSLMDGERAARSPWCTASSRTRATPGG